MNRDSDEERLLRKLLKTEKHEDRMITAMVRLAASSEQVNRRLAGLTWIMLILTWITFVIAIPNTLATVFGIPKVNEAPGLQVILAPLVVSTSAALLIVLLPGSKLSLSALKKEARSRARNN